MPAVNSHGMPYTHPQAHAYTYYSGKAPITITCYQLYYVVVGAVEIM